MPRGSAASSWRPALLYVALTVLLAYPISLRPATDVMSPTPDTDLFMWMLAWDTHAFTSQPLSIFDANIYYPQRHTLAYSENLIGSAVLAAPVLWLTRNPVLALNLVALTSAVLCGLGARLLARRAGVSAAGATLSGIVFAFSPPRFLRLDQIHLATIQWMPFCLAYLLAYLDSGRPSDLRLALAFFTLQALCSGHGVVFLAVAVLALLVFRAARGEPIALGRRLRDIGAVGVLAIAPTALMFVPYLRVQREMGFTRPLQQWSVNASSFFASPSHVHVWLLSLVPQARINETAGAYLFPGCLPIALALVAITWRRTLPRFEGPGPHAGTPDSIRGGSTGFAVLLTLIAVWLSAGPPIGIWPLVYWLPGFNLIRAPSRFMLLAVLGLAVLAGIGFDRLAGAVARGVQTLARLREGRAMAASGDGPAAHRRQRSDRRVPAILGTIVGVLLVGEFAAMPFGTTPYAVDIPAIDRWLATRPAPFAVAEVPLPNPSDLGAWERRETTFMLHSTAHWQKTVHGYSGFRPPLHDRLFLELTGFPDETSVRSLSELGVTYIVVHTDLYSPEDWRRVEEDIGRFPGTLTLEHVEGAGRVYAVHREQ